MRPLIPPNKWERFRTLVRCEEFCHPREFDADPETPASSHIFIAPVAVVSLSSETWQRFEAAFASNLGHPAQPLSADEAGRSIARSLVDRSLVNGPRRPSK